MASNETSGYAPINGLNMYFEIHGHGKPLVLIHGGGSTIQTTFGTVLPLLARHYSVIAVEMQAHGHTKDRDIPTTFKQDADDLAALLRYLGIDKAYFFGFSNGGQTAMQLAISQPALVNKLIIASAFYKKSGAIKGFFENMKNATIADMPLIYKEAYLKINHDSAGLQRMFNRDWTRMMEFTDWTDDEIGSIHAPSLIIAGDNDVVTKEHAVEMAHKIRNSHLLILPGNHGSYIGEAFAAQPGSKIPALTVSVVEEFLGR